MDNNQESLTYFVLKKRPIFTHIILSFVTVGIWILIYFVCGIISDFNINDEDELDHNSKSKSECYYVKKKNVVSPSIQHKVSELVAQKQELIEDISSLAKEKQQLSDTVKFIDESIKEGNRQQLLKEVVALEHDKERLSNLKNKLSNEVNKLAFQKGMIETEIIELEEKRKGIFVSNENDSLSIEYIDNLTNGLDFEQCFASILGRLGYTDIQVTSGSGDFGIDVLAKKDDILYGFQCKLYSSSVGNDAIQQAYSGKVHYSCNIAIVVTNNYFTEQAIEQAKETNVILWDRKTLIRKIKDANN